MSIFNLISMIGGLTFFLYGMNVMSSSLEKIFLGFPVYFSVCVLDIKAMN